MQPSFAVCIFAAYFSMFVGVGWIRHFPKHFPCWHACWEDLGWFLLFLNRKFFSVFMIASDFLLLFACFRRFPSPLVVRSHFVWFFAFFWLNLGRCWWFSDNMRPVDSRPVSFSAASCFILSVMRPEACAQTCSCTQLPAASSWLALLPLTSSMSMMMRAYTLLPRGQEIWISNRTLCEHNAVRAATKQPKLYTSTVGAFDHIARSKLPTWRQNLKLFWRIRTNL